MTGEAAARRVWRFLAQWSIDAWIAIVLLASVVVMLSAQVFMRYALNQTVSWLEEVARFAFVWAIYFGFVVAAAEDRHIRIAVHLQVLPPRLQRAILTLADLIWLGFNLLVVYLGAQFVISTFELPFRSQTTGINLAWIYLIIPIAYGLMSIRILMLLTRRWRDPESGVRDSRLDV